MFIVKRNDNHVPPPATPARTPRRRRQVIAPGTMGRRPIHRQPAGSGSNGRGARNRPITIIDASDEEGSLGGSGSNDHGVRNQPIIIPNGHGACNGPITIIDASDEELGGSGSNDHGARNGPVTIIDASDEESPFGRFTSPIHTYL